MHRYFCLFSLVFILSPCAGSVAVHAQSLLTLEEAVGTALERNYTIRISRNDARSAANDYSLQVSFRR
jgi:hypothetical protein